MNNFKKTLLLAVSLVLSAGAATAQDNADSTGILNFFLDCDDCDFDFVRQELTFVSFVREPQLANVHILVTDSETGGGGKKYFLNFIGLNSLKGMDNNYTITTHQSDTEDDTRRALLKLIKVGILQYYSATAFFENLDIELQEKERRDADQLVTDRWNKWVYRLSSGGEFEKEESQNSYSIETEISARKVTEEWKTEIEATYQISRENYFDDGERITNRQDSREIDAEFIKSITEKWSAGLFGSFSSFSYMNIENRIGTSAGFEYNIFPWKECNRRVFAIRYTAGVNYTDYFEETIYDRMWETLWFQALGIRVEYIQPWGEVSAELVGSHYFHDLSKNRLTLESDISLRVTRNLSVFCELESQLVHDQLYLPKGDASLEDVLLERRKLATTYELRGQLGLRFTFGSIFNNIVNERF